MNGCCELLLVGLRAYRILEISQVLSQAAILQGLNVKTAEFTHEPRMTTEFAHIRIGKEVYSPLICKDKADILVCFEPAVAVELAMKYLTNKGMIITNTSSILPFVQFSSNEVISLLERLAQKTIKLDIFQIAKDEGNIRKYNFLMLGVLDGLKVIPISSPNIIKAIEIIKEQKDAEDCIKALESGRRVAARYKI